jgi:hypothetical protein
MPEITAIPPSPISEFTNGSTFLFIDENNQLKRITRSAAQGAFGGGGGGGGLPPDNNYGDIVVTNSGATWSIAPNAVTSTEIVDGAVTGNKIQNDTITSTKVAPAGILPSRIATKNAIWRIATDGTGNPFGVTVNYEGTMGVKATEITFTQSFVSLQYDLTTAFPVFDINRSFATVSLVSAGSPLPAYSLETNIVSPTTLALRFFLAGLPFAPLNAVFDIHLTTYPAIL